MTPLQVVEKLGGTQTEAGNRLGLKQTTISAWFRNGHIPLPRQYQIQVLTGGALQADPSSVPARKSRVSKN